MDTARTNDPLPDPDYLRLARDPAALEDGLPTPSEEAIRNEVARLLARHGHLLEKGDAAKGDPTA